MHIIQPFHVGRKLHGTERLQTVIEFFHILAPSITIIFQESPHEIRNHHQECPLGLEIYQNVEFIAWRYGNIVIIKRQAFYKKEPRLFPAGCADSAAVTLPGSARYRIPNAHNNKVKHFLPAFCVYLTVPYLGIRSYSF